MKKLITLNMHKQDDKNRRTMEYKDIPCMYTNNTYTLFLDEVKTIINEDQLIRENNEFKFTLDIKNKTALYLLKEKNMSFDILVEEINIKENKSNIILEYKLESDSEKTIIEIIEKEEENV